MYENDGFHPYEDNNDAQNRYEAQSSETSGNQWQQPLYQMPQQPEHTQPKKKHTAGRVVALALCCSLLGGAVGAGAMAIGTSMTGTSGGSHSSSTSTILQGDRPTSAINVSKIDTSKEMTAAEVYAANVNSTVGITTSITTNYWGYQTTAAASGSGFILTADGYILTNYHVIENSDSVKVTMYDGTSYDATIVGYDESNDIAVLKIDATGLTPVVLGDSDKLNVGDSVVAIGNPLGELTFSLTSGAVSALNREVTLSSNVTMDLIQTDCAINSGNSGGALFNLYGEVIGITNAKYSSSGSSSEASIDNIGFAIPINSVRSIVESIIKNGYIVKPYIGVSVEDVSSEMTSYGLPAGAVVRSVTDGAPAAQAGLQANDIITAVDGTEISGSNDLVQIVTAKKAGDTLKLSVYRQGQTLELTVTVAEQKQSALEGSSDTQQSQQQDQDASQGGQQKAAGAKKHQTRQWGGKADQGAVVLPVLFPLVEEDHREHGGHHKVHTLGAEGQHRAHHRAKTGTGHPVALIQQGDEEHEPAPVHPFRRLGRTGDGKGLIAHGKDHIKAAQAVALVALQHGKAVEQMPRPDHQRHQKRRKG